jgi:hypothetical protein
VEGAGKNLKIEEVEEVEKVSRSSLRLSTGNYYNITG